MLQDFSYFNIFKICGLRLAQNNTNYDTCNRALQTVLTWDIPHKLLLASCVSLSSPTALAWIWKVPPETTVAFIYVD